MGDQIDTVIIVVVVGLKFILPVLYLRYPFGAGWTNFLLDSVDGDILVPAGMPDETYQLVDKAADYWTYIFIFIWGWRQPIKREIAATFILRTAGQVLFFITRNELMLFFFPNLLEPLYLIYVSIARYKGWDKVYGIYRKHAVAIWAFILIYKFQDEWITHVGNVDRTSLAKKILATLGFE